MRIHTISLGLVLVGLLACGGDTTFQTDLFTVSITGTNSSVTDGTFSRSLAINKTDFKAEVDQATADFGQLPTGFRVKSIEIDLDESASSLSAYEQVFTDTLIAFLVPDGGSALDVGMQGELAGSDPVKLDISAEKDAFAADLATLLEGDFSLGLRGAATGPNAANFNVVLPVEIVFELIK